MKKIYFIAITIAIIALIIIIFFTNYYDYICDVFYNIKLKNSFDKLSKLDIPWKLVNVNIDGYGSDGKKIILNHQYFLKQTSFTNLNTIGIISNDIVVLDIDDASLLNSPFLQRLPRDTVSAKTPNGYHFYFINDTGKNINCYVKLNINNEVYDIDLFTKNQFIVLPPTCVENHSYEWINSPFTHKIHNFSENMWIYDLFKNSKIFISPETKYGSGGRMCSLPFQNSLILCFNMKIFRKLTNACITEKIKIDMKHGYLFKIDTNYYVVMKKHLTEYNDIMILVNQFVYIIKEYNLTSVINMSYVTSNTFKNGKILQLNSAVIENPEKYSLDFQKIVGDKMIIKTDSYSDIVVSNSEVIKENFHVYGNEDTFVTLLVSNISQIPSLCLVGVVGGVGVATDICEENKNIVSKKLFSYLYDKCFFYN